MVLLRDYLEEKAEKFGDNTFLMFEDQRVSYKEFNERANRVANRLLKMGYKQGDGLAIMMPNCPEYLYVFFGTQKIGMYTANINIELKGEGLRDIINLSNCKVLVMNFQYVDRINSIKKDLKKIERIVIDTTEAPKNFTPPDGTATLAKLMDSSTINPSIGIDENLISTIIYTAGTTGLPKGVVYKYKGVAGGITWDLFEMFVKGITEGVGDVHYTCLPLYHANALILTVIASLLSDHKVALGRRFSASRFWDEVRRYGATEFNALGAMIPILLKQPKKPNDADNPVKVVLSGGCPASLWKEFEERFKVKIWEGYAAADGGGFMAFNMGDGPVGSMGRPVGCEAAVMDDKGELLPPGKVGELVFKVEDESRAVEYYESPEASAALVKEGWFHTGDLVYSDEGGWLYFIDRKRDAIRRRGENIPAFEVERVIDKHPKVDESAAFGVPSELGEDEVMVAVVPKHGEKPTPEELIAWCDERMAYFMVPRYIDFVKELPRSGVERVKKFELKSRGITPTTWDRVKAGCKLKREIEKEKAKRDS